MENLKTEKKKDELLDDDIPALDDEPPDVLGSSPVFLQEANIVRTRSAARASDSFFMILSPLSFAIFFPFNVTGNITEFIISQY